LLTLERFAPARAALQEALALADALGATPLQLAVLVTIAEALLHVGRAERGAQLISLVARHPAADRATSRRAHDALISLDGAPAPAQLDPAALPAILVAAQDDLAALDVTTKPTAERSAPNDALVEPLTEREQDILARIAEGHSNQTIAEALICSVGTVKWYTTQIYGKLGVKSRTQAVARARELGLL
jgi:LuxR family maltose regulon positive regulatory protein